MLIDQTIIPYPQITLPSKVTITINTVQITTTNYHKNVIQHIYKIHIDTWRKIKYIQYTTNLNFTNSDRHMRKKIKYIQYIINVNFTNIKLNHDKNNT